MKKSMLISGGCKNGKSSFAQKFISDYAKKNEVIPIYFATMIPHDTEDDERIKNHREDRKDLGFKTVECGINFSETVENLESGGAVLFDSLTALVVNEMFEKEKHVEYENLFQKEHEIINSLEDALKKLIEKSSYVVFVSDSIFSDGKIYDKISELYRKILAVIENFISQESDITYEMLGGKIISPSEYSLNSKNSVHLVLGGAYQGKTAWVKREFSIPESEICVCKTDELPDFSKNCISHFENYVSYCLKNKIQIKTDFSDCLSASKKKIIICDDIFCGVVPIDSFQRKLREVLGLTLQKIAKTSTLTRIFCGKPQYIS